jgi:hypothetical protein
MNLHIVPDNVFINKVWTNLREAGIADHNKMVVRTRERKLAYIHDDLPFAQAYTRQFDSLVGDTTAYEKVFIHLFTPLLYRWVAAHEFRQLNWMVWGVDLYNLPSVHAPLYENLTLGQYIRKHPSLNDFLYRAKVWVLHERFRSRAYSKVDHVLTWMKTEQEFARQHIPSLKADHSFFFYENDMPYEALDEILKEEVPARREGMPLYVLGNSSTPELNHLDAVTWMSAHDVKADLYVPVSYGNKDYARFLKKSLSFYKGGEVRFIDRYMSFKEYLRFLYQTDGLIMNNIRPQGYGNIFMMMYLGKKIFLNARNYSAPDLEEAGLTWAPITEINLAKERDWARNQDAVRRLLSHDRLLKTYAALFK